MRTRGEYLLSSDLPLAIGTPQLRLVWHPLVAEDGRGPLTEALLRWHHPELGDVGPARFVPLAELYGHIVVLGEWVLREACAQAQQWFAAGDGPEAITVNISPHQLGDRFDTTVLSVLDETGMDPKRLVLELTESVAVDDLARSARALERIRDFGVRIAADDYGVGHSSLARLRELPVDVLKIDQSFVSHIDHDDRSLTIVGGIITTCRALGIEVVAEGVETPAQLQALRMLGCDRTQGYLWTTPLEAGEVPSWLAGYRDSRV